MSRNMGKERVPQVEVLSYDERTRKALIGKFPRKGQKVTTGVGTKRNEILTSVLRGITDQGILDRLAEVQYNLLARTEQEVAFSTDELVDESDKNLLYLKSGDAFFLQFDPYNGAGASPDAMRSVVLASRNYTERRAVKKGQGGATDGFTFMWTMREV